MLKPKKTKRIFRKYRLWWIWGAIVSNIGFLVAFLISAILLVVLVGGFAAFKFVEQPAFCGNVCHNMKSSYLSWKNDAHEGVECAHCHNDPGLGGFIEGTVWGAIRESYLYVTGNFGHEPIIINMQNENCLRHGCHKEERLLEEPSYFEGTLFNHRSHTETIANSKSLHCTSCHGGMVPGKHVAVSADMCALCHMNESAVGIEDLGCVDCHRIVPEIEAHEDLEGADCTDCHSGEKKESAVNETKCMICHVEEGFEADVGTADEMHRYHIDRNIVNCYYCHDRISHGEPE
jgi:hypothetical protein